VYIFRIIKFNLFDYTVHIKKGSKAMKYIHIRLNELLEENGISKNRICKDLDQQRGNFNRYCRDDFQC